MPSRDRLDDLIGLQLGPVRHTVGDTKPGGTLGAMLTGSLAAPTPQLLVHRTGFRYAGDADRSEPGGIAAVYRELIADAERNSQIIGDVCAAIEKGRNCLILTQWTRHVDLLVELLRDRDLKPVVLKGGMPTRARNLAIGRLSAAGSQLLVVATGPYVGEGLDCPALETLFLAAPIAFKGRLVQYVGRITRPHPEKVSAQVHDYFDVATPVLGSSLAKRAAGYTSLGFPDPRRDS